MALPLVNENSSNKEKPSIFTADIINRSAKGLSLSKQNTNIVVDKKEKKFDFPTLTLDSKNSSETVLQKLYTFVVKQSSEKKVDRIQSYKDQEDFERETDKTEIGLISLIPDILKSQKEEEDKEGFLSKLWSYFKFFSYGKMIYKNWDTISKFLGLEKLTQTIRSISDELGISSIIEKIKSTIDDIMSRFGKSVDIPSITGGGPSEPSKYDELFQKIGKEQGVDPALLKSITKAESSFKAGAVSPKGAMGLMQLMPSTAQRFNVPSGKEFDPEENIRGGAKYLKFLTKKYGGDTSRVIAAYNAGEGNVDKFKGIPPFPETQAYVKKVTGYMQQTPAITTPETPSVPSATTPSTAERSSATKPVSAPLAMKPDMKLGTDSFKTGKTALDSVFSDKKLDLRLPTDTATRLENTQPRDHDSGELGVDEKTKTDISIPKVEETGKWATEQDLQGLVFDDHSRGGNPIEYERQLTKLQARKMQELRSELGVQTLHINSGKRKPEYNDKLPDAAKNSAHLYGMACDVSTKGYSVAQRVTFIRAATKVGFGGIGLYGTFIHVDTGRVRTWKTKYNPTPEESQAIQDHLKGRQGQLVDVSTPVPVMSEPGELGVNQEGSKVEPTKQDAENQNKKSVLDTAIEDFEQKTEKLKDFFLQINSEEGKAKLVESVTQISQKQIVMPDIGLLLNQNNVFVNLTKRTRNVMQSANDLDRPGIYSTPFIKE